MFDLIVSTARAKVASSCISFSMVFIACITVEWSRFPNRIPMLFRLRVVSFFMRNMATWRAWATSFVPRPASRSLSSGTSNSWETAWMTASIPTRRLMFGMISATTCRASEMLMSCLRRLDCIASRTMAASRGRTLPSMFSAR